MVENAMAMSSAVVLSEGCFRLDPVSSARLKLDLLLDRDWHTAKKQFEAAYAAHLVRLHGANVAKAARAAGLPTRSLYKILHRLGLWRGTR